jgi:hypothetical protein
MAERMCPECNHEHEEGQSCNHENEEGKQCECTV